MEMVPAPTVGVLHSDMDNDLHQPPIQVVGLKTFVPPGDHATLFSQGALWSLFLSNLPDAPALRSLLSQPVLWRLGLHVAISRLLVEADVRKHQSRGDQEDRRELMEALLDVDLSTCATIQDCMVQIYTHHSTTTSLKALNAWFLDLASLGFIFPPLRPHKRFVYLTQGAKYSKASVPRLQTSTNLANHSDFDLLYLSFSPPGSGDLYFPNSTFQQGRNALLRLALALEVSPGYNYFIFTDEDVILRSNDDPSHLWREDLSANPWLRFEQFLSDFSPMVGFGDYQSWPQATNTSGVFSVTSTHDQCLVAFNRYQQLPYFLFRRLLPVL